MGMRGYKVYRYKGRYFVYYNHRDSYPDCLGKGILCIRSPTHHARGGAGTGSITAKVPVKVWTRIGDLITSPADLINLASVSPQALSAAADLARCPWVLEFRLVDDFGSVPPIPGTTESTRHHDIQNYFYEMGRA